ncbi:MAG: FAD:protein FMN transferase, partial [Limisphaerales bacterium]
MTAPDSTQTVYQRVKRSVQSSVSGSFYKMSFQAMNTICRVHFVTPNPNLARDYQDEVLQWISWFEARYSRFINDSVIGQINLAAGLHWVEVDPETDALFNLCQEMIFFTKGVFDPTALPLIRLWNWKAKPPVVT